MNDTRKQIIELIEPYMDKTLSEGCIVDVDRCVFDDGTGGVYMTQLVKYKGEIGVYYILKNEVDGEEYQEFFPLEECEGHGYEILGHYDITAVLKYIEYKKKLKHHPYNNIETTFEVIHILGECMEIPNKPLHLYIEQEEKDLLELLLKLKD